MSESPPTPHDVMRVAVLAHVDPKTARRRLVERRSGRPSIDARIDAAARKLNVHPQPSPGPTRAEQKEALYDELARLCRAKAEHPEDAGLADELGRRLGNLRALQREEAQEVDREWRRAHPLPSTRDDDALFQAAREVVNAAAPSGDRTPSGSDDTNT